MIQTIREKVRVERIKSGIMDSVSKANQSIYKSLLARTQLTLGGIFNTFITPIKKAKGFITRVIGASQEAIGNAKAASVGTIDEILDPNRAEIFNTIPAIPRISQPPRLDANLMPLLVATLLQVRNFSFGVIEDMIKLFTNISNQATDDIITPVDNLTDTAMSMPLEASEVAYNGLPQGFQNAKNIKQAFQESSIENVIEILKRLGGITAGEVKFLQEKLKALSESSDVYKQAIDTPYNTPVSDLVGLITLGHTIDTTALDPEDWGFDSGLTYNPQDDRLIAGPAQIYPLTTKYKINPSIATGMQESYRQINNRMYLNMFRDRYYQNDVQAGQFFDYPVARYNESNVSLYGFPKIMVTSHMNLGDYSSIGFAKKNNSIVTEFEQLQVKPELIPLIGYLFNLNNLNAIAEKPVYRVLVNEVEILIDSRGNRYLLPASQPDDSAVTV